MNESVAKHVLAQAQRAWMHHGEQAEVKVLPISGRAPIRSLTTLVSKRVEFVVEADHPEVWDTLAGIEPDPQWQKCALVPLNLLGMAHERLRSHEFQLQGWWLTDGRVHFSSPEIA